ncbi:MAG: Fe-S-containing hydro-lyase [Thermodesulfovibrionales bacterium]|nr:Fe-S-containing hydro-lyase [Thermodesulfovibrionales bacterium]
MEKMYKKITTPLTDEAIRDLKAGDLVYISGFIYTARDAAHKRLVELLKESKELPFDIKGAVIYYVGPTPPKPSRIIGSAGPTTSSRMDAYAPLLIEKGLKGMIGKGGRSPMVKESMVKYGAVYFIATGGAGALLSKHIKSSEVIAYEDLGPEAIRKLYVEDFPAIVANDIYGNDLIEEGKKRYKISSL